MRLISVSGGLSSGVDDWDYDLVCAYQWGPFTGSQDTVYAYRQWRDADGHHGQFMHNLIMGYIGVDHEDHDGLNNQRSNLRDGRQYNAWNRRRHSTSTAPYKGVRLMGSGNWGAKITVSGSTVWLGVFATPERAACEYDEAARQFFGEYACLNFSPDEALQYLALPRVDGRRNRPHRPGTGLLGELSPSAALTNEQAQEIRRRYEVGGVRQVDLAAEFGVKQAAISRIIRGVSYPQIVQGGSH
jgi:hypothetical protein